jgi:glycolate oxidase FAD binding subunit
VRAVPDDAFASFAAEVGDEGRVAVSGARTRWSAGGPLADGVRLLEAPAGILDHQPEEMTVRVRAGTPVAELHATLAEGGQRTALPTRGGTVGGAIAVGENDLAVLGRGRLRDAVLQVGYVSAEGRIVVGGGPTVKNVSGFDLPRLLVGSLGTIGLLAEVILRTNPVPAAEVWLASDDVDAFVVGGTVHHPSAIMWNGTRTWVHLEGYQADVAAETARLEGIGHWEPATGPPDLPAHRWSLRPSDLRALASPTGREAERAGAFVASVGVGTVWASRPQPARPPSPVLARLTQQVKDQFDPTHRLNPGRSPLTVGAG